MLLCTLKGCLQNPADYNLPITCAINICGVCRDRAGSQARKAVAQSSSTGRTLQGPPCGPGQGKPCASWVRQPALGHMTSWPYEVMTFKTDFLLPVINFVHAITSLVSFSFSISDPFPIYLSKRLFLLISDK